MGQETPIYSSSSIQTHQSPNRHFPWRLPKRLAGSVGLPGGKRVGKLLAVQKSRGWKTNWWNAMYHHDSSCIWIIWIIWIVNLEADSNRQSHRYTQMIQYWSYPDLDRSDIPVPVSSSKNQLSQRTRVQSYRHRNSCLDPSNTPINGQAYTKSWCRTSFWWVQGIIF